MIKVIQGARVKDISEKDILRERHQPSPQGTARPWERQADRCTNHLDVTQVPTQDVNPHREAQMARCITLGAPAPREWSQMVEKENSGPFSPL